MALRTSAAASATCSSTPATADDGKREARDQGGTLSGMNAQSFINELLFDLGDGERNVPIYAFGDGKRNMLIYDLGDIHNYIYNYDLYHYVYHYYHFFYTFTKLFFSYPLFDLFNDGVFDAHGYEPEEEEEEEELDKSYCYAQSARGPAAAAGRGAAAAAGRGAAAAGGASVPAAAAAVLLPAAAAAVLLPAAAAARRPAAPDSSAWRIAFSATAARGSATPRSTPASWTASAQKPSWYIDCLSACREP
jgi:hypothetical protein